MNASHSVASNGFIATLSKICKPACGAILFIFLYALVAPAIRHANAAQEAPGIIIPDHGFNAVAPMSRGQENHAKSGEAPANGPGVDAVDVTALVREAQRNGAAMHKQFLDYTYTLRKTRRVLDEHGKPNNEEAQEFEAYPVHGEHVLIQVSNNGAALPAWRIAEDRKRAGAQLVQAEREESKHAESKPADANEFDSYAAAGVYGRTRQGKRIFVSIDLTAFLRYGEFSAPRSERLDDREMIVLSFHIRPGATLPPARTFIAKFVGQIWIDVADKVIVRLEAWPAPESARKEGALPPPATQARLVYQQAKLPTGVWFPSLIRMNSAGDESIFDGLNWDVAFEFSDYKQFKASIEDVQINDSKKHP